MHPQIFFLLEPNIAQWAKVLGNLVEYAPLAQNGCCWLCTILLFIGNNDKTPKQSSRMKGNNLLLKHSFI